MTHRLARATGALDDRVNERWGDLGITLRVVPDGYMPSVPARAWTDTRTGEVFLRESVLAGIGESDRWWASTAINALVDGRLAARDPYPPQHMRHNDQRERRVVRAVLAAGGVVGHERSHAAFSEHAARHAFHMALEDLRVESLWMALDPIRARMALRASAIHWVTRDKSPMDDVRDADDVDVSHVRTPADLLMLFTLVCGRARSGILSDASILVTTVDGLARTVLGGGVVSDAYDLMDRFLATSDDETQGDARLAIAREYAALVAGVPSGAGGCGGGGCQIGDTPEPEPGPGTGGQQPDGDAPDGDAPGGDAPGGADDGGADDGGADDGGADDGGADDGGADDGPAGDGAAGSGPGDDDSGDDIGGAGSGGEDAPESRENGSGSDSGAGDDSGTGSEASGGPEGPDGPDGPDGAKGGTGRGSGEEGDVGDAGDGGFGAGGDGPPAAVPDHDGDAHADTGTSGVLTPEQARELAEGVARGLAEVDTSTDPDIGWAIDEKMATHIKAVSVSARAIAADVFGPRARTIRNSRMKRSMSTH